MNMKMSPSCVEHVLGLTAFHAYLTCSYVIRTDTQRKRTTRLTVLKLRQDEVPHDRHIAHPSLGDCHVVVRGRTTGYQHVPKLFVILPKPHSAVTELLPLSPVSLSDSARCAPLESFAIFSWLGHAIYGKEKQREAHSARWIRWFGVSFHLGVAVVSQTMPVSSRGPTFEYSGGKIVHSL